MFVRWIVRGHRNADVADVTFHDAYLVESYRDESGQPRQNVITYLGNIRQLGDEFPGIEREIFLLRARLILQTTPQLAEADVEQVLQQLYQKIRPLTADEVMVGFRHTMRWYYQWWQRNGGAPTWEEMRELLDEIATHPDSIEL